MGVLLQGIEMQQYMRGSTRDYIKTKRYRFGFILSTTIGNKTHYLNLRKYAEKDGEVDFVWAPVNHYTAPDFVTPLRVLPEPLFMRARVLQQAHPVLRCLNTFDAVMIHLFEAEVLCSLRSYFPHRAKFISSTDEAPMVDRDNYPLYPNDLLKPAWRQQFRLALDRWRVGRMDGFVPFSDWAGNILVKDCGINPQKVHPIHVGIDLESWRPGPRNDQLTSPLKILFVGSDFQRKGGTLLLDVFNSRFKDVAQLHIVSKQAPQDLPPNVYVHSDFEPNDQHLIDLYKQVDLVVVPTTADLGPLWVFLEAMAMELPIVGTNTGSNTELVRHNETGFVVKIGDPMELSSAIHELLVNRNLRLQMGARGRRIVEARYSAGVNVPRILQVMKDTADAPRV